MIISGRPSGFQTLWLAIPLLLAACAGKTTVESDLHIKGAPDWVNEGSNILKDQGGRLFHGVGSAPQMGDQSLQISTADNRARAELARIFTSYMEVVSNDYLASAAAGEERLTEQSVSRQINNVSQVNLVGARIIGHWKDRRSGDIYAIAELDIERIKKTVRSIEEMDAGLRDFIRDNATNIFDRMEKEGK